LKWAWSLLIEAWSLFGWVWSLPIEAGSLLRWAESQLPRAWSLDGQALPEKVSGLIAKRTVEILSATRDEPWTGAVAA
jgi:hypothetical protein